MPTGSWRCSISTVSAKLVACDSVGGVHDGSLTANPLPLFGVCVGETDTSMADGGMRAVADMVAHHPTLQELNVQGQWWDDVWLTLAVT